MLRRAAGVFGSAVCYAIGHLISRLFLAHDSMAFMYPLYNRLMISSADVEDWAGIEFMWSIPRSRDIEELL